MPDRRRYLSGEVMSAVDDAAGDKPMPQEIPATSRPASDKAGFSRAPQSPAQQAQLRELLEKQRRTAEALRR